MGLPNVNIEFSTVAASAIVRSQKGIVALILKDDGTSGAVSMTNVTQMPSALSEDNKAYIQRAFLGYVNPPQKVIAFVQGADSIDLTEGLTFMGTQQFDYLCGPPEITEAEATAVSAWIKSQRADNKIYKAVLPNVSADNEGVINFTTNNIKIGNVTLTTAQFCSRIAGLIAGTPMTISCANAPLLEVEDITRLTKELTNSAIDKGQFVLIHDGKKVKVGRGVTSFTTTTQNKSEIFKKIKIVEAVDMISSDIRMTAEDSYIGKYSNSYDNKLLLVTAISSYLSQLERDGILDPGKSSVGIDVEAQDLYLQSIGTDTSKMSEQQIKEANTQDKVFLSSSIKILDAIEDIDLSIIL